MIIRRILILIPQLIIISILVFILGAMMPGDALSGMIDPGVSAEVRELQREKLGLNDPLAVRYVRWIGGIVRGDFGESFIHRRPVLEVIGERMANTFFLSLAILVLTYTIAIPLGVLSGRYSGTVVDKAILFYVFVSLAMPTMVLGILMILFFSFYLGWFPSSGSVDAIVLAKGSAGEILANRLHHMVLPAATGALVGMVGVVFMLRANIIDRAFSDYVTLARSKGVPEGAVFRRHILRNSLIPVAAGFGFAISGLLTGQLFIERIFQYPGMGHLFFSSVKAQDFAVVNAIILIFSALTALGMLISDILLSITDPRIRPQ
ncbi:MAG: ABC transporter permease [Clostridiales bacterium]|jgi:peptide/nickel transport system permease protein|nr:ABC transporter permease [Clostridiales bacterium]